MLATEEEKKGTARCQFDGGGGPRCLKAVPWAGAHLFDLGRDAGALFLGPGQHRLVPARRRWTNQSGQRVGWGRSSGGSGGAATTAGR